MGFFDTMQDADFGGRGTYISPGFGEFEINEISVKKGRAGLIFVCEFIVREFQPDTTAFEEQLRQMTEGKGPYAHPKAKRYSRHEPGSKVSFVQVDPGSGDRSKAAAGAVKGFVHGLTDGHSDEFLKDPKYFDAIKGNDQIARGTILTAHGNDFETKTSGRMITGFDWALKQPSEALIEMMNEMLHNGGDEE